MRNLLRRRLRMIIRSAAPRLRPGAYLVGVAPAAASLTYRELEATVLSVLKDFETT